MAAQPKKTEKVIKTQNREPLRESAHGNLHGGKEGVWRDLKDRNRIQEGATFQAVVEGTQRDWRI